MGGVAALVSAVDEDTVEQSTSELEEEVRMLRAKLDAFREWARTPVAVA